MRLLLSKGQRGFCAFQIGPGTIQRNPEALGIDLIEQVALVHAPIAAHCHIGNQAAHIGSDPYGVGANMAFASTRIAFVIDPDIPSGHRRGDHHHQTDQNSADQQDRTGSTFTQMHRAFSRPQREQGRAAKAEQQGGDDQDINGQFHHATTP
ncbi:hypothetical protein RF55_20002 [Lasius niger]|uniref:Uncharacterized protein n=1 Tax=Lasius niger TaxID=67767 RepID=A0A0J7JZW4_LASNI|nr:hypothetical protein RF55_20002 [Lasius niger]